MSPTWQYPIDPKLDLVLERTLDIPAEQAWRGWTRPELLKPWFCPKPWSVSECRIDLRPGGEFHTTMRSPEGEEFPNSGCYLEIVEGRKLVWTDTLLPGFRPAAEPVSGASLFFTGVIQLEPQGERTRYTAICIHRNEEDCNRHRDMGFHEGWSVCADQLVAHMRAVAGLS